jgi:alkanesulfonate monooxygenase SsuD/methylene tetrahydromethanopterin reductase-like flavin-dependent oxidoreductase (luciferase family)
MQFGFRLAHVGAAANGPDIIRFAQRTEAVGFESSWSGEHIVLPVAGTNQYPYTADLRTGQVNDMLKSIEHLAAAVVPAVCD